MGAIQSSVVDTEEDLNALLADLNLMPDEMMVESEPTQEQIVVSVEIASALAEIEAEEIAAAPMSYVLPKTATPANESAVVEVVAKPAKASKPTKAPKAPKEPKTAKEPVERVHYANKVERISAKLGDQLGDYTVLELADAMLTGIALKSKQRETLDIISGSGKKVQNRQTFILEFIAGKSIKLNGVIQSALTILAKDGFISTGVEGNFYKELLAKPYSVNAAKAMGGNTLIALKTLKVIIDDAGKWVANPNSLILAKLKAMGIMS